MNLCCPKCKNKKDVNLRECGAGTFFALSLVQLLYDCHLCYWYNNSRKNNLVNYFSSVSHYEVLDVPESASQKEIKKAFFEKSKKVNNAITNQPAINRPTN